MSGTPGGERLRVLRQRVGKTQLWVEVEADLGTGYLQRVEYGKVQQPGRGTLDRILDALGARYSERREVLESFGYRVSTPLPDVDDIAWAREVSRAEMDGFPFPAYALDCAARLIAWNRATPLLFGIDGDDPALRGLADTSILEAWFDPASPLAPLVVDPDQFLPALMRAFRHESHTVQEESWHREMLARLMSMPRFRRYWEIVEQERGPVSAARAIAPLRLRSKDGQSMLFRLSAEPFTRDARFRLVYYFPSDIATMRRCASWAFGDVITSPDLARARPAP
jgi:transcriptional regulator with XRE-family HTH domain